MSESIGLISVDDVKKKSKGYLIIAVWLAVLSAVEVWVTFWPGYGIPKGVADFTLVLFACVKAGMVGWYYMHLNHETKWLAIVALTPVIAAFYAGVLVLEAPTRPTNSYSEGRARSAFGSSDSVQKIYGDYVPAAQGEHKENHEAAPGHEPEASKESH